VVEPGQLALQRACLASAMLHLYPVEDRQQNPIVRRALAKLR
jgi:hypothetical protein